MKLDPLDVGLEDTVLLEELQLTTELMIGASEHSTRLDQRRIDVLLGVGDSLSRRPHIPQQPGPPHLESRGV